MNRKAITAVAIGLGAACFSSAQAGSTGAVADGSTAGLYLLQ